MHPKEHKKCQICRLSRFQALDCLYDHEQGVDTDGETPKFMCPSKSKRPKRDKDTGELIKYSSDEAEAVDDTPAPSVNLADL